MNKLLLELIELQNKIHKSGELSVFPIENGGIEIRCTWFLDKKYGYSESFKPEMIYNANLNLLEIFAHNANREISRMLSNETR